ncbi:Phospholipase YtpA [Phytophthora cinnamomi]|uniref:Phospholipase YtpA n=1 Tax=Phytophthora cinnamomi TaxID=4785 RepID=UPI0035596311|nr:Phospholipase YtpA [Phytophthora cinnamomi]
MNASVTDTQSPTYSSYTVLVPPALQHFEGRFANARNQLLFYFALFPPDTRPLHGVVLFLHGSGDHCRRYIFLYEHLCEAGYGVIAYDMVNHGASHCDSSKTRGHIRSFRHLVEDTNAFITFAKQSLFPQVKALRHGSNTVSHRSASGMGYTLPLIISGVSFGALLGMHTVLSGCHEYQAAFWGGATVGMEMSTAWKLQATVIQALSLLVPKVRLVAPLDYEMLWRDPGYLEDFKADALATTDDLTARTMQQTMTAMNRLMRDKRIEQPDSEFCRLRMLFLTGSEDHIADQGITRQFFSRLANIDKEFEVFDGVFHCVFEDPERDAVVAYVLRWLHRGRDCQA